MCFCLLDEGNEFLPLESTCKYLGIYQSTIVTLLENET